ncbi:trans-sialidase [Trypanosoma cruzi Dm28c]|uniref:Trans-sialidase n=2 Tax=Trypanosoma cruzi TaxID=5693 RepID=V5A4Z9_TRYCR|nr:trans-sialidase [Trypanosoma cruzi Dm28c]PBJ77813.1 trans-sialidase [Trypanosoma cruzi cruzi]PWU97507.1 putative trans-sialidase, Group VI [Trypanosoma cruzi]
MLSRVAAVMAPRTHNRRRVIGSSGRRREVRESERQRPNMSRHHFCSAVLLLVLVMMCCGSGGAAEIAGQSTVSKFEWKDIKYDDGVTVESLGAPGLLKVGSDVFAVAEAQCKEEGQDTVFTGIASQIITMETGIEPKEEVLKDAKKDTQFLEEVTSGKAKKVDVSRPTAVVEGSNIYILVGKHSHGTADTCKAETEKIKSGMLLVKGEVSEVGGEDGNKKIRWNETGGLPCTLGAEHESLSQLIFGGGSGVKLRDATFLFPVEATKKKKDKKDVKTASLIIHNSAANLSWKLSKGMSDDGCSDPSVVEWEKDQLMMMTACDDGRRRVYEIGDKGESWTEALGTLSRVWSNKKGEGAKAVRSGFITATIGDDNKNVMLVTLPVYPEKDGKKEKGELHLWLTDNTHIVDIGPVSGDDDAAASSLLYKSGKSGDNKEEKEELIALYEKKGDEKKSLGMVSVPLAEQLQRVKDVLATWKKVDETVFKLCISESDVEDGSPGDACSPTVKITDGLVGFLSGNFSDNTWRDEYLGVNATVKANGGAAKTSDGVKFTGAWAEWPVGSQGENQLYHFANYNFTLVATVSIDGEPKEEGFHIPLIGVKVDDDKKTVLFGLSYKGGGKWKLSCGGGSPEDHSINLATETTHHVLILLRNGTQGSAYVDGKRVGGDVPCALENKDSKDKKISHFYIGGDGNGAGGAGRQEEVSVTVRNVLLYNRPLSTAEIGALNPNKASSPSVVPDNGQGTVPQSSSAGQLQSEQGQQKVSNGAGAGGASTPATSTAAASSGQEPVKQPTSGTSPSGNKNADGAPSSDADPTVTPGTSPDGGQTANGGSTADSEPTTETREGGTNGQEKEEVNSHNGEVNATALSSLGNVSQGNNSDAGTVRGSGLLPSLLLLLGLWVFAAL